MDRLTTRMEQLEHEKRILLEQLARRPPQGAQEEIALAYAEAGLPGCGSGRDPGPYYC